jgi:hypothetical protein
VPGNQIPEVVAERQIIQFSGDAAVEAVEELKSLLNSEPNLELTLTWRLRRKGTQP